MATATGPAPPVLPPGRPSTPSRRRWATSLNRTDGTGGVPRVTASAGRIHLATSGGSGGGDAANVLNDVCVMARAPPMGSEVRAAEAANDRDDARKAIRGRFGGEEQ